MRTIEKDKERIKKIRDNERERNMAERKRE